MSGAIQSLPMNLMTLGEMFAKSGFFQDSREAAQAIVKIQAGAELGFPPVASMTGVYIVKGKVSLSANLIAAAIKRSGKYTYAVNHLDDAACVVEFFEGTKSIGISEFTMADAKRQGTQNTDRFPRNMLFARAISNGAKWFTPDVFGGPVYTPDELGAHVDEDGQVVTVSHPAPPSRPALPPSDALPPDDVPTVPSTDPLADNDAWTTALDKAFKDAGFDVPEADACIGAVLKSKKIGTILDMTIEQRNKFITYVGSKDAAKKFKTAAAA